MANVTLGWPGSYPPWLTSFRPHQLLAAQQIIDAYNRGADVVLLDAPVGTGKTLIAEMVRQHLGVKGTYVCHGLTLQDQFLHDFTHARVLKGRANYPTLNRPSGVVNCGDCTGVSCRFCDPKHACPYVEARRSAAGSEVAVLNTAYMMSFKAKTFVRPFVVLDECDQIEPALMRHCEFVITGRRMKMLDIEGPIKAARKATLQRWLEETFVPAADEWRAKMGVPDPEDVTGTRLFAAVTREWEQARDVATRLEDGWVRDYSTWRGHEGDLILKPVTVGGQGAEMLWNRGKKDGTRWLGMSGTIISPDEWVESCGVEAAGLNWEVVSVPMMFDVANRPIVVKPVADMSRAGGEEGRKILMDNLAGLIDRHHGENILVHTVSYGLMREIVAGLRARGVHGVISYETSGDRELALTRFKDGGGVIVAPSLDRGVDLPGDLCRVVVVAKMPFGYLGDRQISERMRQPGGQLWYAVNTTRTLVQMTGRGVRHETDTCVTYVLDKQFGRYYGQWGKRLLPGWWRDAIVGDNGR